MYPTPPHPGLTLAASCTLSQVSSGCCRSVVVMLRADEYLDSLLSRPSLRKAGTNRQEKAGARF